MAITLADPFAHLHRDPRYAALLNAGLTDPEIAAIFEQDDRPAPGGFIAIGGKEESRLIAAGLNAGECLEIEIEHREIIDKFVKSHPDAPGVISFLEENQPELAALLQEDPALRAQRLNRERQARFRAKRGR